MKLIDRDCEDLYPEVLNKNKILLGNEISTSRTWKNIPMHRIPNSE
jgi:hypothetical protein